MMPVTLFSKGGPLMWLILLNAALALMIFFERLFHYHRAHIDTGDFVGGIRNALSRGNDTEAKALCEDTPGPVAHLVKTAVVNRDLPPDDLREMLQDAARVEVARLEKRLVLMATIAQVTPLIGFLGTVMGMISLFMAIEKAQLPSPGELAGGVWVALLTTAGGLAVAVPAYVAYNYLVTRVQNLLLEMEHATNEILAFIKNPTRVSPAGSTSSDQPKSDTP
jgi:biopolymer transport protein ExbB